MGTIKGVGKIYRQTVINAHNAPVFAKQINNVQQGPQTASGVSHRNIPNAFFGIMQRHDHQPTTQRLKSRKEPSK